MTQRKRSRKPATRRKSGESLSQPAPKKRSQVHEKLYDEVDQAIRRSQKVSITAARSLHELRELRRRLNYEIRQAEGYLDSVVNGCDAPIAVGVGNV